MNPQARRLLLLLLLVSLGQSLSGLFVQAYMWEQGGGLPQLARYNFAVFIAMAILFAALGPAVKRGRSVLAYRLGLALQVGFYLAVLALGDRAGAYLPWLGALNGAGLGAYWVGGNLLIQQATDPANRARYWGYVGAVYSATALTGPLVGSRLVAGLGAGLGYQLVFGLAATGYGLAWLLANGLQTRGNGSPYRLAAGLADPLPGRPWVRVLIAHIVAGFREGILGFLPAILVYVATGDPRLMGNFAVITAAVGLCTNWLTGRFLRRERWFQAMLGSGILQAAAALFMLAHLDFTTVLLYSLVGALVGPLQGVPFITHTFDTVGTGGADVQIERIVIRENFLVIGRSAGMVLLLALSARLPLMQTAIIALIIVALAAVAPAAIVGRRVGTIDRSA